MTKLTKEELAIEQAVIDGKYKPIPKAKWTRYQNAAAETMKKIARINIRMKTDDLEDLKRIAERKGMPYQTLIGSVLHRFAKGNMLDADDVEQVRNLKVKAA